ncbi:hypothetical protein [Paenibacillus sp. NPDC058071]|uniref:hypothetical protein n=1 Tax=Paenibacillus sp. NPDC058071 TaxID=3346326 RepID=UPI0036DF031B
MEDNRNNNEEQSNPYASPSSEPDGRNGYGGNDYGDNSYGAPQFGANPDAPARPVPLKHSGVGIASFVLAIISVLLGIAGIILSISFAGQVANDPGFMDSMTQSNGEVPEGFLALASAGLTMIIGIGCSFIGLILGIVSVASRNRRKVFGIIGLILNGLIVLGMGGLMLIGFFVGAASAGI